MYPFITLSRRVVFDSWQVMAITGIIACVATAFIVLRKETSPTKALIILCILALAAPIGGHLTHCLIHWGKYSNDYKLLFHFWGSGQSSFGAMLFCIIIILIISKIFPDLSCLKISDAFAMGAPLAIFFVRLGCHMKGCCWGKSIPDGHFFQGVSIKLINNKLVSLHPVQLYSASASIIIFVILIMVYVKHRTPGIVSGTFVLFYFFSRFFLEFFRGDSKTYYLFGFLSINQIFCIVFFISALLSVYILSRKSRLLL
jgi:phosphatidylglycerol:prolipoprotein diacylglycerol transferase